MNQDSHYGTVGNPITWNQYVALGYYEFDDCFQFETQWTKLCTNLMKKYTFLWFSYTSYHTIRYLEVPIPLNAWATEVAHSYLTTHLPDAYTPETLDPRNGRFDDSDDDMEYEEDKMPANSNADDASSGDAGWTPMGAHGKPVKSPPVDVLPKFSEVPLPPPKLVSPVASQRP